MKRRGGLPSTGATMSARNRRVSGQEKSSSKHSATRYEEPIEGQAGKARHGAQDHARVETGRGSGAVEPAEWHDHCGSWRRPAGRRAVALRQRPAAALAGVSPPASRSAARAETQDPSRPGPARCRGELLPCSMRRWLCLAGLERSARPGRGCLGGSIRSMPGWTWVQHRPDIREASPRDVSEPSHLLALMLIGSASLSAGSNMAAKCGRVRALWEEDRASTCVPGGFHFDTHTYISIYIYLCGDCLLGSRPSSSRPSKRASDSLNCKASRFTWPRAEQYNERLR
jgi:hypothetical protein